MSRYIAKTRDFWLGPHSADNVADWPWRIAFVVAAVAIAVAAFLPLWKLSLDAPQYPEGLGLTAYGTHMEGDIEEINSLNHYIGVEAIEPDSVVELKLFPYAVAIAVVGLLAVAAFPPRKSIAIGARITAWAFPLGMLVDLQWWLYRYGHNLDPAAPVRVDPFTPRVIGSTRVVNFDSEATVAVGFWLMVLAAVVATLGPLLMRFVRDSWKNTGKVGVTAASVVLATIAVAGVTPGRTVEAAPAANETALIAQWIDEAESGAVIEVPAGTYRGTLTIDKSVTLVAGGEVVLDGGRIGDVVVIEAEDVTLDGFIVQGSAREVSGEPTGIRVLGDRATLLNNIVRDSLYGIALLHSDNHVVRNNHVSSIVEFPTERRGHAYYLYYTRDNLIEDNVAITAKDGIFVGFGDGNRIDRNVVSDVRYGIHYMYANDNSFTGNTFRHSIAGAALMYSEGLVLHDNEFSYNTSRASGYGILIKDVDDVVMTGNRIHHNRLGMTLEGFPTRPDSTALVEGNLIGFNQTAIEVFSTTRATFTGNTFVGNLRQVESRSSGDFASGNSWSLDGRGNYWDSYEGYDATGDGVGDRAYEHRAAFESLMDESPALKAYSFTMAHQSFELAARWFAPGAADPILVDPAPLMSPTISLSAHSAEGERLWMAAGAGVTAIAIALAMLRMRHTLERRWLPC